MVKTAQSAAPAAATRRQVGATAGNLLFAGCATTGSATIRTNLLQQRKTASFQKWLNGVKKEFAKKIHYQAGYTPESVSTATDTTSTT